MKLDGRVDCAARKVVKSRDIRLAPRSIGKVTKLDFFKVELDHLKAAERHEGMHGSHHRSARPHPGTVAEYECIAGPSLDPRDHRQGPSASARTGAGHRHVAEFIANARHD